MNYEKLEELFNVLDKENILQRLEHENSGLKKFSRMSKLMSRWASF
jgi:hypothetical protein